MSESTPPRHAMYYGISITVAPNHFHHIQIKHFPLNVHGLPLQLLKTFTSQAESISRDFTFAHNHHAYITDHKVVVIVLFCINTVGARLCVCEKRVYMGWLMNNNLSFSHI